MADKTPNPVEKVQEVAFNEIYLPTFVNSYNEKAAAIGLPPLQSEEDLAQALDIAAFVQEKKAEVAPQVNPLADVHEKVASLSGQPQVSEQITQYAINNEAFMGALRELVDDNTA